MTKRSSRFLALLRGINVGGKNIIAKEDLRQCFEDLGFTNVRTYIQSGNILFRSKRTGVKELTAMVEDGLSKRFDYEAQAVVLSHRKYQAAVDAAPAGWGTDDDCKHNALFTLHTTTPAKILAGLPEPKEKIECVTAGPGVIFWSIRKEHQTKTTLMRLPKHSAYQEVTVRNHNTVLKLLDLFAEI